MPHIGSTLPSQYGAVSAGAASRSRAGSAASYNSTVTLSSIQGIKTLIANQLVDLEEAQLTIKNTCTTMVRSGTMSEEALGNVLRAPLIDQYMRIYQEEVLYFDETSEEVRQAMTRLDKLQEEEEAQAQRECPRGGARVRKELTGAQLGQ